VTHRAIPRQPAALDGGLTKEAAACHDQLSFLTSATVAVVTAAGRQTAKTANNIILPIAPSLTSRMPCENRLVFRSRSSGEKKRKKGKKAFTSWGSPWLEETPGIEEG
jgi:hypothetical protein